jgi:hypothetical protein
VELLEKSQLKEALAEIVSTHPVVPALAEQLREDFPNFVIEGAKNFRDCLEETITEALFNELQPVLDSIDPQAYAEAVLSNESLRGQVVVKIEGLAYGLGERIKHDIDAYLATETHRLRNLQTLRRNHERTQGKEVIQEASTLKVQHEKAKAKGEVLYYKLAGVVRAFRLLPVVGIAGIAIGALGGLNYPAVIGCNPGDKVCHQLRIDGNVQTLR